MGVKVGCNVRAMSSLVPRLFSPPVFDGLQYTEGTLALVRQKYGGGIVHICRGCEASDYPRKVQTS